MTITTCITLLFLFIHMLNVKACPSNEISWKYKEEEFNCTKRHRYHCIYTQNGPVEYCGIAVRIEQNRCPTNDDRDGYYEFQDCMGDGCPMIGYLSNQTYRYPGCFKLSKSTVSKRFTSMVPFKENSKSQETTYFQNNATMYLSTSHLTGAEVTNVHFYIIIGGGVFALFLANVCCIVIYDRRKRRGHEYKPCARATIGNRELHPEYDDSWDINPMFQDFERFTLNNSSREVSSTFQRDGNCECSAINETSPKNANHFQEENVDKCSEHDTVYNELTAGNCTFRPTEYRLTFENSSVYDECQSVYVYHHLKRGTMECNPCDDDF